MKKKLTTPLFALVLFAAPALAQDPIQVLESLDAAGPHNSVQGRQAFSDVRQIVRYDESKEDQVKGMRRSRSGKAVYTMVYGNASWTWDTCQLGVLEPSEVDEARLPLIKAYLANGLLGQRIQRVSMSVLGVTPDMPTPSAPRGTFASEMFCSGSGVYPKGIYVWAERDLLNGDVSSTWKGKWYILSIPQGFEDMAVGAPGTPGEAFAQAAARAAEAERGNGAASGLAGALGDGLGGSVTDALEHGGETHPSIQTAPSDAEELGTLTSKVREAARSQGTSLDAGARFLAEDGAEFNILGTTTKSPPPNSGEVFIKDKVNGRRDRPAAVYVWLPEDGHYVLIERQGDEADDAGDRMVLDGSTYTDFQIPGGQINTWRLKARGVLVQLNDAGELDSNLEFLLETPIMELPVKGITQVGPPRNRSEPFAKLKTNGNSRRPNGAYVWISSDSTYVFLAR